MGKVWKRRRLMAQTAATLDEATATVEAIIENITPTSTTQAEVRVDRKVAKATKTKKTTAKKGSTNAS